MMPQDEFLNTDLLCYFIDDFNIDHVMSVSPETEWGKIYGEVKNKKTRYHKILTGYLSDDTVRVIKKKLCKTKKTIDIGYRAKKVAYWLGRHGCLKYDIAEKFVDATKSSGLIVDISTDKGDVLIGNKWLEFLTKCKYTIGVEGGASILDRDGSIKAATEKFINKKPNASFNDVEEECFPGRDGEFKLFALSPRHLESCMTKTCQILVEGEYDGVLKPLIHYIPLRKDLSNIDEILAKIKKDICRSDIVEKAYEDIVISGNYSYSILIKEMKALFNKIIYDEAKITEDKTKFYLKINEVIEIFAIIKLLYISRIYGKIVSFLPEPLSKILKKIKGMLCAV